MSLTSQIPCFSNLRFQNGAFHFQELHKSILPPIAWNLFGTPAMHKYRCPIVMHNEDLSPAEEDITLASVPMEVEQSATKRSRPTLPYTSLKKLKILFNESEATVSSSMLPKKLKVPKFHAKFSTKSLVPIEAPRDVLVPMEGLFPRQAMQLVRAEQKKKRGRPLGSKHKNSSKTKKIPAEEVLSVICLGKPPSTSIKGKEKT